MFEVYCSLSLLETQSDVRIRWTVQRKVFGKPLHSQAVIRAKLAGMISRVESMFRIYSIPSVAESSFANRLSKLAGEYHVSNVQYGR